MKKWVLLTIAMLAATSSVSLADDRPGQFTYVQEKADASKNETKHSRTVYTPSGVTVSDDIAYTDGHVIQKSFDSTDGTLKKETEFQPFDTKTVFKARVTTFDKKGNTLSEETFDRNSALTEKRIWSYDRFGKLESISIEDGKGSELQEDRYGNGVLRYRAKYTTVGTSVVTVFEKNGKTRAFTQTWMFDPVTKAYRLVTVAQTKSFGKHTSQDMRWDFASDGKTVVKLTITRHMGHATVETVKHLRPDGSVSQEDVTGPSSKTTSKTFQGTAGGVEKPDSGLATHPGSSEVEK